MPTMTKFTAAPNGVAAAALVHLESGDVNVFVHAIRIEAPVRNQQSQIHAVVQHVMKEVKGVDPKEVSDSPIQMDGSRIRLGSLGHFAPVPRQVWQEETEFFHQTYQPHLAANGKTLQIQPRGHG